jgi:probable DNA metabolism protein
MPYQADVKDLVYQYDGTFPGFLCCIFESFSRHEIPAEVCTPEEMQLSLFERRQIATDSACSARVYRGLNRLGATAKSRLMVGFLNTEPGKDLTLLRFSRLCFEKGAAAVQMLGDEDVAAAFALERAVQNDACLCKEFLRFQEREGMLGAILHPRHCVLPLMRAHFCSRLPDENFLIYDATHGAAMLRKDGQVQYLRMQEYALAPDAEEEGWLRLWKHFFKATDIPERYNPKCQMNHCRKHYWQDMPEMLPEKEGTPETIENSVRVTPRNS